MPAGWGRRSVRGTPPEEDPCAGQFDPLGLDCVVAVHEIEAIPPVP